MCTGMLASVPIPCFSINEMSSASDKQSGGLVCFSTSFSCQEWHTDELYIPTTTLTQLNSSLLTNGSRMAKRNTVHKNKSNDQSERTRSLNAEIANRTFSLFRHLCCMMYGKLQTVVWNSRGQHEQHRSSRRENFEGGESEGINQSNQSVNFYSGLSDRSHFEDH